jgi:hypothetical protein
MGKSAPPDRPDMKTFALAVLLFVLPSVLHAAPAECSTTCGGVVLDLTAPPPPATVPALLETSLRELPRVQPRLEAMSPEARGRLTVVVTVDLEARGANALDEVEGAVGAIIVWARAAGPFAALGIALPVESAETEAYTIKRLGVSAQGLGLARRIAFGPASAERLGELFEYGAQAYFDELVVHGDPAATAAWLRQNDPAKQIIARVEARHPNVLYDVAGALAAGASRVYVDAPAAAPAIVSLNRELASDYTHDPSLPVDLLDGKGNRTTARAIAFVRGEDLRTLVVAPGHPSEATIVSVRGDEFIRPQRIDAAGAAPITDTGRRGGQTLVGLPPGSAAFAITLDRPKIDDEKVTREAIEVVTGRSISVEEIIRNHQAYRAFQDSIQPRYIARNQTSLRFGLGPGGEAVETTLAGDYFFDPAGRADWVWQDFLVNGVKWKYGRIPEIPILQPERVTQLPLDLHLTRDYRYQLVRKTNVRGFETWEVRFEPPPNAPASLPLYRGTVWIDAHSWARVRMSMMQLNLKGGEVLSNEERIDYHPFDRATGRPLTTEATLGTEPSAMVWLPIDIGAQQTFSVAGAAVPVLRATRLIDLQIDPEDFDTRLESANRSNARMVRETDAGLRYLEKDASGQRVVKEGMDTARVFLIGGLHRDAGLEFGVIPLGGLDYFNYNLWGRGLQTNIFFAGVFVAANLTNPSYRGSRTNLGADFFGIALPFDNTSYRDGRKIEEEAVRTLPFNLNLRAGRPAFGFGKVDAQLGLSYISYQQAETTADDFSIPVNTFEIRPGVDLRYDRWGYSFRAGYEHGIRTDWQPWGDLVEYDQDQEQYSRFVLTLGKSFYLPKFQRLGVELDYLDGRNLDRFSKYELGYFGAQRVRGIQSGSVRAERALLGHLSYGFVITEQFRIEAFYDHALIDDASAGYRREPFQGIGIAGQTIGPWGTLLRLDIGKSVGRNAQDEVVANIVFLKLFG